MDEMVLSSINSKIPSENSSARGKQFEREGRDSAPRVSVFVCCPLFGSGRLFGSLNECFLSARGGRRGRGRRGEARGNACRLIVSPRAPRCYVVSGDSAFSPTKSFSMPVLASGAAVGVRPTGGGLKRWIPIHPTTADRNEDPETPK